MCRVVASRLASSKKRGPALQYVLLKTKRVGHLVSKGTRTTLIRLVVLEFVVIVVVVVEFVLVLVLVRGDG